MDYFLINEDLKEVGPVSKSFHDAVSSYWHEKGPIPLPEWIQYKDRPINEAEREIFCSIMTGKLPPGDERKTALSIRTWAKYQIALRASGGELTQYAFAMNLAREEINQGSKEELQILFERFKKQLRRGKEESNKIRDSIE